MPEGFIDRRRPRRFRIVFISLQAFLDRFILKREAPSAVPAKEHPPAPGTSRAGEQHLPPGDQHHRWKCGVPRLDEQYDELFRLVRKNQGALKAGTEPGVLEEALSSLASHLEGHLPMEEAYLNQISFPGLVEHRRLHQAFLQQVQAIRPRIAERDPLAGLELSQLLFAWMRVHVGKEDPIWSEFARSRRRH
jgi:hemerythrin